MLERIWQEQEKNETVWKTTKEMSNVGQDDQTKAILTEDFLGIFLDFNKQLDGGLVSIIQQ